MKQPMPKLKEIFESNSKQSKYQFIATFDPTAGSNDHGKLKRALNMLIKFRESTDVPSDKISENKNGQFLYTVEQSNLWDFNDEEERNKFCRAFYNSCSTILKQFNVDQRISYVGTFKKRFEEIEKRLPELKGLFENALSHKTNKSLEKYSLHVFSEEEKELIEAFANVVIKQANANKSAVRNTKTNKVFFDVSGDEKFRKIKQKILANTLLHTGWRNFYSPALIHIGVPSLCYINGEFCLQFKQIAEEFNMPELSREKDWKTDIIERLQAILAVHFQHCLDAVDEKNNPLSLDLKKFFDWREDKIKLSDLNERIPELRGIFESENSEKFVLTVVWENLEQTDKQILTKLLKDIAERHSKARKIEFIINSNNVGLIYYNLDWSLSETAKDQFVHFLNNAIIKLFPDWIYQESRDFLERIFKTFSSSCLDEEAYFLKKRLPELNGMFESKESFTLVDVVLEIQDKDRYENPTTSSILELIAKHLQKHNCWNMEETWECKIKPWFNYEIKHNPLRIVFLDIPKNIAKTYMDEMTVTIYLADRHIGSELAQDHSFILSSALFKPLYIDEKSPKIRAVGKRLPELEGFLESITRNNLVRSKEQSNQTKFMKSLQRINNLL